MLSLWLPDLRVEGKQSFRFTKTGRRYPVPKVKANADEIVARLAPYKPVVPYEGPLHVEYVVVYPWNKTEPKRNIAQGSRWKDTAPDWDQLAKQLNDCLERAEFFHRDAQITSGSLLKKYGTTPGVGIRLWRSGRD